MSRTERPYGERGLVVLPITDQELELLEALDGGNGVYEGVWSGEGLEQVFGQIARALILKDGMVKEFRLGEIKVVHLPENLHVKGGLEVIKPMNMGLNFEYRLYNSTSGVVKFDDSMLELLARPDKVVNRIAIQTVVRPKFTAALSDVRGLVLHTFNDRLTELRLANGQGLDVGMSKTFLDVRVVGLNMRIEEEGLRVQLKGERLVRL